jgi:RNA polymerase sigma factor (sigma-70 family)
MSTPDHEVAAQFLRGEPEAVTMIDGWIARAAWPYQRRLANRWDDVLQDVRLEITRLLQGGKFRGESSLRTYLWRVVSHTCLDQIRSQSRWQWTDLEALETAASPGTAQRTASEDLDLLLRVLEQTPDGCRELWRMVVAGLSYREMSLRLGVSEGALRVRVLRCREKAVNLRAGLLGVPAPSVRGRNVGLGKSPKISGETNADEL